MERGYQALTNHEISEEDARKKYSIKVAMKSDKESVITFSWKNDTQEGSLEIIANAGSILTGDIVKAVHRNGTEITEEIITSPDKLAALLGSVPGLE